MICLVVQDELQNMDMALDLVDCMLPNSMRGIAKLNTTWLHVQVCSLLILSARKRNPPSSRKKVVVVSQLSEA